jgi:hypothetical protein
MRRLMPTAERTVDPGITRLEQKGRPIAADEAASKKRMAGASGLMPSYRYPQASIASRIRNRFRKALDEGGAIREPNTRSRREASRAWRASLGSFLFSAV